MRNKVKVLLNRIPRKSKKELWKVFIEIDSLKNNVFVNYLDIYNKKGYNLKNKNTIRLNKILYKYIHNSNFDSYDDLLIDLSLCKGVNLDLLEKDVYLLSKQWKLPHKKFWDDEEWNNTGKTTTNS